MSLEGSASVGGRPFERRAMATGRVGSAPSRCACAVAQERYGRSGRGHLASSSTTAVGKLRVRRAAQRSCCRTAGCRGARRGRAPARLRRDWPAARGALGRVWRQICHLQWRALERRALERRALEWSDTRCGQDALVPLPRRPPRDTPLTRVAARERARLARRAADAPVRVLGRACVTKRIVIGAHRITHACRADAVPRQATRRARDAVGILAVLADGRDRVEPRVMKRLLGGEAGAAETGTGGRGHRAQRDRQV